MQKNQGHAHPNLPLIQQHLRGMQGGFRGQGWKGPGDLQPPSLVVPTAHHTARAAHAAAPAGLEQSTTAS